ncbi:MAG TPA: hypothetical protein VF179_12810 [Thermoanaerobaculia bacterium]|nr:hypothetical protein [Thermoanaerobaculia bacterium]
MMISKPQTARFTLAAFAFVLLALTLPVSGSARDPLAIVAEARGHVAVSRQHEARFDGSAFEIAARTDESPEAAPSARFELVEVRQGATLLATGDDGAPRVQVSGRRISYARAAGIVERYDVTEAGVEQSFVLRRRTDGEDLAITVSLAADRELGEPHPDGSGGFVIPLGDGTARLRYGAATAIDADGDRRGVRVEIADGQVTLTVDGPWLAAAAYPVVVDPLISVETNWRYQGRPAAAFDFGGSASISGATHARYLVAYESDNNLGVPLQIWGKLVQWNGTLLPMSGGDPFFGMSLNISNDSTVAHTRPTAAFKFGRIDSPKRNYLVAWQRSDGALGYRILDRSGSPLMAPAKIAGSRFQDVSAATGPSGGWAAPRCGTTFGCTPYLLAYRVWSSGATAGPVSSVRLSVVEDGTGALLSSSTVETYAPVDDPIYAPSIAYGHSSAADYFVLAYRRPTGEIVARKVDSMGAFGPARVLASSSNGPPVVAYSHANNRWAVFWRANVTKFGTSATIQGQTFPGNSVSEPIRPEEGVRVTAVSVPLGDFDKASGLLPDYSAAGTRTATGGSPFQGLFELAYARNGEIYSVQVYTGGKLGSTTRLTNNKMQDRYVKVTAARIDPPTTGLAGPLSCTGAPGSRCALWVYEHFHGSTNHDITGYVTSSQY